MKTRMKKIYKMWGFEVSESGQVYCEKCKPMQIEMILHHEVGCPNAIKEETERRRRRE